MKEIKDFFIYGLDFLAIAAGITQTSTLLIQADSDFELMKLTFASDLAAGVQTDSTRTIPQCSLIITDTGSGRQLMNSAIDLTSLFGDAKEPFIMPVPKRFRANTAITVALKNYSAAQSYNVHLSFVGAKVFKVAA